jgi:hypothetical protein
MTMDALFNLRDEITGAIESRAADLRKQLSRLTGDTPTVSGKRRLLYHLMFAVTESAPTFRKIATLIQALSFTPA